MSPPLAGTWASADGVHTMSSSMSHAPRKRGGALPKPGKNTGTRELAGAKRTQLPQGPQAALLRAGGRKRRAAQEDLALREGLAGLGLRLTRRLPHARAGLGSRQRRSTSEGEGWTRRGGPRRSSSFTGRKLPLSLPPRAKRRPGGMLPAPSPRAHTSHECVPSGLFHTSSSVTRPWTSKD